MTTFHAFGLSDALNASLRIMNYNEATPIQAQAIPLALKGRDILGSAQTGTGKTAAFSIPLVEKLMRSQKGSALVLTPTRELAKQVLDVIHQLLGPQSPIKTAFIIGGEPMGKQFNQLRAKPRIIVGTPGRINDHLERGSINLSDTDYLVLDETDRMLDMGFGIQLDAILKHLPKVRQTLLFSATLPPEIVTLASKYTTNAERIAVGATNVLAKNIKTEVIRIHHSDKYKELQTQLLEREGSVIIFIKTKHAADRMADNLRKDGFTADALHGDLRQHKRDRVMHNYRKQNFRILVATDIAARGLDVPHIEHVINYDLPQVAEDYIHRMGRTARAGAQGHALCFISPEDGRKWHAIERLLNPDARPERSYAPEGKGKKRGFGARKDEKEWGAPRRKSFSKDDKFGGKREGGKAEYKPRFKQDNDQSAGERGGFGRKSEGASWKDSFKPASKDRYNNGQQERGSNDRAERASRSDFKNRQDYNARGEDRPRSEGRPRNDAPFKGEGRFKSDRPFSGEGKPRSERSFNGEGKPRSERPFNGEGKFKKEGGFRSERSAQGEGRFKSDRPFGGEGKRRAERSFSGEGKPRSERPFNSEGRKDSRPAGVSAKKPFKKGPNGDAPLSRGPKKPARAGKPAFAGAKGKPPAKKQGFKAR